MSDKPVDRVLFVSTSATQLGDTPTGLWLEELAAPYYILKKAGYAVTIASVKGGAIPLDKKSLTEETLGSLSKDFQKDEEAQKQFKNSLSAKDVVEKKNGVSAADFAALYVPGGHGIMADGDDPSLAALVEDFYANGRVVGSVCHGPAGLLYAQKEAIAAEGKIPLLANEEVTGFSDAEEAAVGADEGLPYSLEARLKELGATYKKAAKPWEPFVVTSNNGRLVTGQNPQSSEAVGHALVEAIKGNNLYVSGFPVAAVT